MSWSIRFRLPADFVLDRCIPTEEEITYGVRHGLLSQEDAIALVAAIEVKTGHAIRVTDVIVDPLSDDELNDEATEMYSLIRELETSGEWAVHPVRLWMFLALEWLYTHRDQPETELAPSKTARDFGIEDNYPLAVIAMIHADFWYNTEIEHLVHFLPPRDGKPVGREGLFALWRDYLEAMRAEYGQRDQ